MPSRPPRVCSGCGAAVTGRCATCAPPAWSRKPSSWKSGSTSRWRRFRNTWLAEHPLCAGWPPGTCGVVAEHVDHITPLHQFAPGPARETARFDTRNVQSLCVPCHRKKTAREGVEVRRLRSAQERTWQLW